MIATLPKKESLGDKGRAVAVFGKPACPQCGCEMPGASISMPTTLSRYNLTLRRYYGWCDGCNCGCEVEQYRSGNGRWFIHRYRNYTYNKRQVVGKWVVRNELPVAAVLLGVGRGYDRKVV